MKIPRSATSAQPPLGDLTCGTFRGPNLRHTYRENGTDDWLLIYTLGGSGLYQYGDEEFRSAAHDITLFRPGAFQNYRISPKVNRWDLYYAHFLPKADWLPWLHWPELTDGFMVLSIRESIMRRRIVQRLRHMIRLFQGSQPRRVKLGQNALEEALLWCDAVNPARDVPQIDPRVRKAMDYLGEHAVEPFSEEMLARAAGLSPSRLRHLFRTQAGDSPRHYQETQRLRRARDLLAMSQQSISEIANELGFENPFYFTLRFKKETGESPRDYRKRIIRK